MDTLVASWAGSTSDSYISLTNANSIAALTMDNSLWAACSDEQRQAALRQATVDIDGGYTWIGERLYAEQALEFPRSMDTWPWDQAASTSVQSYSIDQQNQAKYVPEACVRQAIHRIKLHGKIEFLELQRQGVIGTSHGGRSVSQNFQFTMSGKVLCMDAAVILRRWRAARRLLRG